MCVRSNIVGNNYIKCLAISSSYISHNKIAAECAVKDLTSSSSRDVKLIDQNDSANVTNIALRNVHYRDVIDKVL